MRARQHVRCGGEDGTGRRDDSKLHAEGDVQHRHGGPLHSMVLVGETHPLENDMLAMHRATEVDFLPEDMVPSQYLE